MLGTTHDIDFLISVGKHGWASFGDAGTDGDPLPALIACQDHLNWPFLTTQLYRHRLMGLAWRLLTGPWTAAGGTLPRGYALYETWHAATAYRNRRMREEAELLIDRLRRASVEVLLRRGPALIGDTYADPGVRPMSDLDLLISPGHQERFTHTLTQYGYKTGDLSADKQTIIARSPQADTLPRLLKTTGDPLLPVIIVDAATNLSHHTAHHLDCATIFDAATASTTTPAPVMAPPHLLLDLCLHIYEESTTLHHVHRGRFQRLMQYVDLLAYLNHAPFAWNAFLEACDNDRLRAAAFYALGTAQRLYPQAPIPQPALRALTQTTRLPEDFLDLYGADELSPPARWSLSLTERLFTDDLPPAPTR
ncbi:nucleotidyltransferase family protein (plasmid) [Streptosporangium sp. NBC_01495]|uniref:nucleotidyltransferase family protein n=1 Tax=Streptosporangium sp. NBC_01495 TaxID=2903899 RepID=UPI002E31CD26|nr:nucleotidyltransferase family protein [Streptosporangium sp. NBC_01495]